ncbi:Gfo/Idh/MocA family protein [Paenibacillus gorillae]|uniref:Gfo/Idh/MocA family protein n=1 Tax=Paenibacillus gorillae TaxID=1243662 RepID=UPI0004B6A5C5|nr:Gfo/Idh/MocA family oxidoreductase [Paenibacillus gorillae]
MVRFGIIGSNFITESFVDAAGQANQVEITAIYSRTADKAQAYADKHGIANTFTDIEEMASSDLIDAIYIASPNSLHAQYAITFMKAGKHVLCEKPIASNTKELRQMIETAKQHQVLLMEAMKSTLVPNFEAIQQNLQRIGKVRHYYASFCQYSSRYDAYKEGVVMNAFLPEFSNGSLMDIGTYCIYPLVVLFGKPDRIQASAVMLESGVDGKGSLILSYGEMEAVLQHSKISSSNLPAEIQGEGGNIIIERISQPSSVRLQYRDGSEEDVSRPQVSNTMVYEIQAFADLIHAGQTESPVNSYANSLTVMEIMDEARRQIGLVFPADQS